jgi:hypothetical protein
MANKITGQAALPGTQEGASVDPGELPDTRESAEQQRVAGLRDAFFGAVDRLEQIIELETALLQRQSPSDLRDFNHKKSHGLLEITRTMRALDQLSSDQESLARLARLRTKLAKNLVALESHLRAVRQVSAVIARAIEADDSDGTYSTRGYRPVQQS